MCLKLHYFVLLRLHTLEYLPVMATSSLIVMIYVMQQCTLHHESISKDKYSDTYGNVLCPVMFVMSSKSKIVIVSS